MRIAMIGTGYVGLVSGACFSEFGIDVVCVDKDRDKIARLNRGEIPIYEPGLEQLVGRNRDEGRLSFSTDLGAAVAAADAVVMKATVPVGTGAEVAKVIRQVRPDADFDVASNPEFLREGSAINDFMRPDRGVIGVTAERAREVMRQIYRPLCL